MLFQEAMKMEAFTIVCRCAAEGDSLEQICALCLWMLADAASLTSLPNP
jgi:hypothetical protein